MACCTDRAEAEKTIRSPAVAGSFYNENKKILLKQISEFLSEPCTLYKDSMYEPLVLFAPHAGYEYSGKTAGCAYQALRSTQFDTVILIGPKHSSRIEGAILFGGGNWSSPLGTTETDEDVTKIIADESPEIVYDQAIHDEEHSLETQLPFIQALQPNAQIVPILINDVKFAPILASAIKSAISKSGKKILIIASSDMSHHLHDDITRMRDKITIKAIKSINIRGLQSLIDSGQSELCGAAAVMTALNVLKSMPDSRVTVLRYNTSAESSGDYEKSVGYMGAVGEIARVEGPTKGTSEKKNQLSEEQKNILKIIALKSLHNINKSGDNTEDIDVKDRRLNQHKAVFVTLKDKNGNLRGCIGRILPEEPLWKAVYHMARQAALEDSRFQPVREREIPSLSIEISVLTTPVKVRSHNEIKFPGHGVIVKKYGKSGVYLPQVSEQFATKEEFLDSLCSSKADLDEKCWKDENTEILVFETESF
ncbi:AmmeMemoRadiSam system protein B [Candidatus Hydrogenosomobacter endosymbioticus]|uniref:AMMECR1 domain-containing protein n=1 Tax=Candidatus Hydrogenosomobacter endosymbioticus TaxID=2558174 RepID=A0ABM7V9U8_9PROT|nr:AmmeMemoRadiSam system protein B [Candidatus Hydrogenosomobacter endosymbioticus]BDB96577.1 hypothetical protein HYD_7100 [Candidatus Hydrogenosomobacter endosymbioticus]